jgi:hypothetical protein
VSRDPRYVDLLAEGLCRALVDHGRVDGAWSAQYDRAGPALPPVFTVIIPTCDRPGMVEQAVASVLAQPVTGLEVLVVDDGLHHPPADLGDERVRVLQTGGGRGPAAARNAGIDGATGRYLAFLDDDDLWTEARLDLALRGLRRAPVAICQTRHLERPPTGRVRELEGLVGGRLLEGTTPCLGATAVERAAAPRFDERWLGIEDVVWWWELAQRVPVTTEHEVGYLVRLHHGARGRNAVQVRVAENLRFLAAHRAYFRRHRRAAAHRWLRVAVLAREARQPVTAVRAAAMHLLLTPRIPRAVRSRLAPLRRRLRRLRR